MTHKAPTPPPSKKEQRKPEPPPAPPTPEDQYLVEFDNNGKRVQMGLAAVNKLLGSRDKRTYVVMQLKTGLRVVSKIFKG